MKTCIYALCQNVIFLFLTRLGGQQINYSYFFFNCKNDFFIYKLLFTKEKKSF